MFAIIIFDRTAMAYGGGIACGLVGVRVKLVIAGPDTIDLKIQVNFWEKLQTKSNSPRNRTQW